MSAVTDWYRTLEPREQRLVFWGGIAAVVLAVLSSVMALGRAVDRAEARVERKREDLAWMQAVAPRLGAVVAPSDESLAVLVDRTARDAGLGQAVTGAEPSGESGLRVKLEGGSFDQMVVWLGQLQQTQGVSVESANVTRADGAGLVNASLVLTRR